jgi:hypothetical protein
MDNNNTDKNVYILGAGFSKEIGLPLQDDFLLRAKEVFFRNPSKYEHFEKVFEYQNRQSVMRTFLSYPLLNLENLFNLLEMDLFYSRSPEVEEIKKAFVQMIKDVIVELTPCPFTSTNIGALIDTPAYSSYSRFLRLLIADDRRVEKLTLYPDTIITFNYDLVLEGAIASYNYRRVLQIKNPPFGKAEVIKVNALFQKGNVTIQDLSGAFKGEKSESLFNTQKLFDSSESSLKLIKLHGSINWHIDSATQPFLIPPTWNKSDDRIRKLWDIAYNEIRTAKRIIIIGYSFPEADIYVKSLLALALNKNRILQNIYFINPDKDMIMARCLSMLDSHFAKHCSYQPWTFREFLNSEEGKLFIKEKLNRELT